MSESNEREWITTSRPSKVILSPIVSARIPYTVPYHDKAPRCSPMLIGCRHIITHIFHVFKDENFEPMYGIEFFGPGMFYYSLPGSDPWQHRTKTSLPTSTSDTPIDVDDTAESIDVDDTAEPIDSATVREDDLDASNWYEYFGGLTEEQKQARIERGWKRYFMLAELYPESSIPEEEWEEMQAILNEATTEASEKGSSNAS
ncbi:hypothetical protein EV356DRAFT_535734 [Viridothelium virens]|uniref:Uncharacterized protein n=1 Tax=Viridothelium virens TaxID=1048519 RepID=A0A6A6GZA9_VIRVR|nr:hypothetical protein EV356DRAFT_535734 [Viridothelium virens]